MQQVTDLEQAQVVGPTFLTIGNFDGLHRGHQALLQRLQSLAADAAQAGMTPPPQTGLLIFDPHPLAVLRPESAPPLLTTPAERLAEAAKLGIDLGIIQPFTPELAQLEPAAFLRLLKEHLQLAVLVVGPDFALGRNRAGNIGMLRELGKTLGYQLQVVEPILGRDASQVRSSLIRQLVSAGDVAGAVEMLGRYYAVQGEVVLGDQRGRQIGTPTANLQVSPQKLLPAYGVYATLTRVPSEHGEQIYPSVTNFGVRPTVDGLHQRLETHLLDFPLAGQNDKLYGYTLTVEFVARLRAEQRFADLDALKAQIQADIAAARLILQPILTAMPV